MAKSFLNCASCARFFKCKHPDRAAGFICDRYKGFEDIAEADDDKDMLSKFVIGDLSDKSAGDEDAEIDSLMSRMESAMSPKNAIAPDLRIDDRDMPQALNFWDFCHNPKFADQDPLPRQLVIASHLFGDYCPRCSNPIFHDIQTFPVDYNLRNIESDVTFLHHGVCPKCKARRSELVSNDELIDYYETAICAGQRCVTGDTLILTDDGMVRIDEYLDDRNYGFTPFVKGIATRNGRKLTSMFYRSKPEILKRIHLYGAHSLSGTMDHPVMTDCGFKRLEQVNEGGYVQVCYGQRQYGSSIFQWKDASSYADERNIKHRQKRGSDGKLVNNYRIPRHKPGGFGGKSEWLNENSATMIGLWVAEGHKTHITNLDQQILDYYENALLGVFHKDYVWRRDDKVGTSHTNWFNDWWSYVLDVDVWKSRSADKVIPSCIRKAPENIVTSFMRGMFEGDGGIEGGSVTWTTISKALAVQTHAMLLNIGIPCRLHKGRTWATNGTDKQVSKPKFVIHIEGRYAISVFAETVGFMSQRKKDALQGLIDRDYEKDMPCYYDKLPPSHKTYVLDTLTEVKAQLLQLKQRSLGPTKSTEHISYGSVFGKNNGLTRLFADNVALSKQRIAKYMPMLKPWYPHLSDEVISRIERCLDMAKGSYWFEKVRSTSLSTKPLETYDVCVPGEHNFISNGILSHNSGKSIGTSLLNTYIIHRYIKLQNPVKVFKQTKNTHFSGTLVGLTFGRAKSLLYEPIYDLMSQSEWFRDYHAMLEHYGDQYGEELFTFGKEMMIYKHRQLVIHPASPNKRSLRGDTRMLGSIDELGWFPYGDESDELERAGANEVYTALDRALGTIRLTYEERVANGYDNLPNAYGVYVSSPSAYNDKIMSLVRTFEGSDTSLAAHFASWEMNPQITRKSKIIVKAYKENHVKAERDYGANPPLSDASYIEDISTVQHIFTKKRNVLGNYKYGTVKRGNGVRRTAQFKSLPKMNGPTVLAIDAGASNNSFGLAVGALDFRDRPLVYGMMEVAPAFQKPLDYSAMYDNIILPICEAFNVAMLVSDRWNSMKILHDFEKDRNGKPYEVRTENVTLKKADFDFILDSMMSKDDSPMLPKLEMSFDEMMEASTRNYPHGFQFKPVSHMFFQMATVRATHKTVDKGQGYTDDVFRATMLLLNTLYTDDTQEWLHGLVKGKQKKSSGVIGVTASRSSTGGSNMGRGARETSTTFAAMGSRVNLGGGPSGKR